MRRHAAPRDEIDNRLGPSLASFKSLVAEEGADIAYCAATAEAPGARPLYECTWNHTTLHALKITYLQALYPADRLEPAVPEICALFPEELIPHLEFVRFGGRVTASGLPLIRYTSAERLNEIIAMHEARGIMIADPHLHARGRHAAQARRCRPARLQAPRRSVWAAEPRQDAQLRRDRPQRRLYP